jgi:hypothetical protein
MEEALRQIGLPVKCAYGDCEVTGHVKPGTDYGGWYKSKMFRFKPRKRWFCPEHYEDGRRIDNKFYENYRTPDPYPEQEAEATIDELYKLID